MNFVRQWLIRRQLKGSSASAKSTAEWLGECDDPDALELLIDHVTDEALPLNKSSRISALRALGCKTDSKAIQVVVEFHRAKIPASEESKWQFLSEAAKETLRKFGKRTAKYLLLSYADDYRLEWLSGFEVSGRGFGRAEGFLCNLFGNDARSVFRLLPDLPPGAFDTALHVLLGWLSWKPRTRDERLWHSVLTADRDKLQRLITEDKAAREIAMLLVTRCSKAVGFSTDLIRARGNAVSLLARQGEDVAIREAIKLFVLHGSNFYVRDVMQSLPRLVETMPDMVKFAVRALKTSKEDDVRERAARVLGEFGDARTIPALREAAIGDSVKTVQIAAFWGLRSLNWQTTTLDDRALQAVLLKDDEEIVRLGPSTLPLLFREYERDHKMFRQDGSFAFSSADTEAPRFVDVILRTLKLHAPAIDEGHLRTIRAIRVNYRELIETREIDDGQVRTITESRTIHIDCSGLQKLAEDELKRRGVSD